jgi:histidinol dehydrogenase
MRIISWQEYQPQNNQSDQQDLSATVAEIIRKVRVEGDKALREYTLQFDRCEIEHLTLNTKDESVKHPLESHYQEAIEIAYQRIEGFHQAIKPRDVQLEIEGIQLARMYKPLSAVGLYIPGGQAPLVSTLLMLAIPARIAGCQQIVLCTPAQRQGIAPAILYAAARCGIECIYQVGGAHAIAAMAYGTETIPKVDKIFGPGNRYVTEAKIQVARDPKGAALDMPAGPSEVLVIADEQANPSFVASDLLAQAEHDPYARCILVTPSRPLAESVLYEIEKMKRFLSRQETIAKALSHSSVILTKDLLEAFTVANQIAPEHLIVQVQEPQTYLNKIHHAGAVFLGPYTPEALGDYASGPNHVLPTEGYARCYSGLGVEQFMKAISVQQASASGFQQLAPVVEHLATLETLDAHAHSITIRRKFLEGKA